MGAARLAVLGGMAVAALGLAGAVRAGDFEGPLTLPDAQLEPLKWSDVAGWGADDHLAAFNAFQVSCQALLKGGKKARDNRPVGAALVEACRRAAAIPPAKPGDARKFFEDSFRPVRISKLGESEGFLTGYYEPIVQGSRFPNPEFPVALYRRPRDLVAAGHKPGADNFPNKGVQVGRRNDKNEIVPYYDRAAIEDGALDGRKLEICWLRDPFEALSISIQGSARIILEDGTPLRVNYDAHNGYAYTAVGRVLIERNHIPREEMSMQRIREWMAVNPVEAREVRASNRSFVFFRITGLSNEGEPNGAQGVPLTALRSIAVDKLHAYGTPFFIEAQLPIDGAKPVTPFRRLMIAQDTGSAIVGPARADLYWGAGAAAGRIAGRIRHPGRFVMLLPRELDLVAAGRGAPLPIAKPAIPDDEVAAQPAGSDEAGKPGKDEAKPASPRKDAAGKAEGRPDAAKGDPKAAKKPPRQAGPARARPGS
jgi:membrane-bound lytic murein transglycosylase A